MPTLAFPALEPAYQELTLSHLDLQDHTFVVSFDFELNPLVESIRQLGLLSPPLLRLRGDGRGQVVCGFKRLLALKSLSWPRFGAWVVPEATPSAACLLASLHDNALTRGFNLVERAQMIARLLKFWEQPTVIRDFLPLLHVPPSPKHLEKYNKLMLLEPPFQELAARGHLGLETAAILSQWAAADRLALWPLLSSLPLSYSKQGELVESLITLSRRQGVSPRAILSRPQLGEIIAHPSLTPSQKVSRLREQLHQWCFPRLCAAQHTFDGYLKSLELYQQPDLRLSPPPAFEGATFQLQLHFDNPEQLAQRLRQLLELTGRPEFMALTRL